MIGTVEVVGGVALLWAIIEAGSRRNPDASLHHKLAETMKPFAGVSLDKEAMWRSIGGVSGVCRAFWAAGAIATLANRCERIEPASKASVREIFLGALALRVTAALAVVEAGICVIAPAFPRVMAGALVRLYCDLVWELDAVQDFSREAIVSI